MAHFLVWNSVFRTFLSHALLNFIETWQKALVWVITGQVRLSFRLTHFCKSYGPFCGRKFSFPHFSKPCFNEFHWNLSDTLSMHSYRKCLTSVPVDSFLYIVLNISVMHWHKEWLLWQLKCRPVGDSCCNSPLLVKYDLLQHIKM